MKLRRVYGLRKKIQSMIKSFIHKGLEDYHYDGNKKGIQSKHAVKLADILDILESVTVIEDINHPGYNLHLLEPKSKNRWSVKVSGNWRVTFIFREGNAYKVDYEDYH